MLASQVVILTDLHDAHVPFVQKHLPHEAILIDPQELARGTALSIEHTTNGTTVRYGDRLLDNVSGVWYRKPQPVHDDVLSVPVSLRDYSRSAIERQYALLQAAFPDARYVSDYHAALRASNKLLQLQVARQLGFTVADTLFTGSAKEARAFLGKHPESITKRLSVVSPTVAGRRAMFMTARITPTSTPDLTNLHSAPAIFQQAIHAKHDIRVTVVGDKVFPAYIKSEASSYAPHIRDARIGSLDGTLRITKVTDFPEELAQRCIAHTKAMGLNFAAIDLIQDMDDVVWFVETNAGGQWAYVEVATKQPIGKALADLLLSGS